MAWWWELDLGLGPQNEDLHGRFGPCSPNRMPQDLGRGKGCDPGWSVSLFSEHAVQVSLVLRLAIFGHFCVLPYLPLALGRRKRTG